MPAAPATPGRFQIAAVDDWQRPDYLAPLAMVDTATGELWMLRKDGAPRWVRIADSPD